MIVKIKTLYLISCLCLFLVASSCDVLAQNSIDKKLIGVWETNRAKYSVCIVFINQNSGAITDSSGLVYFNFSYQITPKNDAFLFTQHIPVYDDQKGFRRSLIQLSNDTTLFLNDRINGKSPMQGKKVVSFRKLENKNLETFLRKPSSADLLGSWLRIVKKDTSLMLTFKENDTLAIKDYHTGKQVLARYNINFKVEPTSLDMINDNGEVIPTIFIFEDIDRLRFAGPKRGKRRTRFTTFGDNFYLKRVKL